MLERHLADLERRARRSLASRDVDGLLREAEEHLGASIQARLELGQAPEVAEQEAVAAFGDPKTLVQAANAVHRSRFQGAFLAWTTLAGLGWAFALLASPILDRTVVVMAGVVFFTTFGCLVEGSKVRRPLAPLFAATAAFWLGFTAICAWWVRDFSVEGWIRPHLGGSVDLVHATLWAAGASAVFFGYLVLAYRKARPAEPRRRRG